MKQKTLLSYGRIIAGCIFLFNPNVNMIDLLPDVIGYLLLLWGIRGLSGIAPYFEEASNALRRMAWISLLKLPALLIVFSIYNTSANERGIFAVVAFGFAVIDVIFAWPAMCTLLRGFTGLGEMHGIKAALSDGAGKEDNTELLKGYTLAFVIIKAALSFLPELSLLSVFDTLGSLEPGAINPAKLYPFFVLAAVIIGTVVGLLWLVRMLRYFSALRGDPDMAHYLETTGEQRREDVLINARTGYLKGACLFLLLGLICSVDLVFDHQNYLPDWLSAIAFIIAAVFLARVTQVGRTACYPLSLAYLLAAIVTDVLSSRFFDEFALTDIPYNDHAAAAYRTLELATVVEGVLLSGLFVCLWFLLRGVIHTYVGTSLHDGAMKDGLHRELTRRSAAVCVCGILVTAFHVAETFLLAVTEKYIIPPEEANEFYAAGQTVYFQKFGGSWFITLSASLLLLGIGAHFLYCLRRELFAEEEED